MGRGRAARQIPGFVAGTGFDAPETHRPAEPWARRPLILPAAHHDACLYDDFEGPLTRLRWALAHVDAVREFSLQEQVARFDWRRLAPVYDARLDEVLGAVR